MRGVRAIERNVKEDQKMTKDKKEIYIPKNLKECFVELKKKHMEKGDIERVKGMPEDEFSAVIHHGLGRWIRNNWGLWTDSRLFDYFKDKYGITHADDMSGIIFASFHRHLNGKDLDIEGQVEIYKKHWEKMENKKK